MTVAMAAILITATTLIMIVITVRVLAISGLAAVGTIIFIIPDMAYFCSTMLDADIRCASNIAGIGVNGGKIGTANAGPVTITIGAMTGGSGSSAVTISAMAYVRASEFGMSYSAVVARLLRRRRQIRMLCKSKGGAFVATIFAIAADAVTGY